MAKKKEQNLNDLLFSSSHNEYQEEENSYDDEVQKCEDKFLLQYENQNQDYSWRVAANQHSKFMHYNGPSIEFSANYSQNSMTISHRQDDDIKEDKKDYEYKYLKFYEQKKKEEIEFNEALQKQINAVKQELQRSKFEISKLQGINKGLESKLNSKENEINQLEETISNYKDQISKFEREKRQLYEKITKKDEVFHCIRTEMNRVAKETEQKQYQNNQLKEEIRCLVEEVDRLNAALSIYNQTDRKLYDFKGRNNSQTEALSHSKKNPQAQREIQALKKDKENLSEQIYSIKEMLQDRQSRFKSLQQENRKKILLKQRKIQELEQKLAEAKEQTLKMRTQTELNMQKINTLNIRLKEINVLNDRLGQNQKRIKNVLQECKKKDERIKDIQLQLIQKEKALKNMDKQKQELKSQQQFDHHLIEQKDKMIQKIQEEKRSLRHHLQNQKIQKIEKIDKVQKNIKVKSERQLAQLKKEYLNLKKNMQSLEREKEDLMKECKQLKKKYEEATKKYQQLKTSNNQFQEMVKEKEEQLNELLEKLEKMSKELGQAKKQSKLVHQFKNKVIILEERLKQNQNLYKSTSDFTESLNLSDKIQALECRLQEKDRQIRLLRNEIKSSTQSQDENDEDYESLVIQLQQKQQKIIQLEDQLTFKDNTLEFTHKMLLKSQKDKITLQQQKKLLEERCHHNNSNEDSRQEYLQFYEEKHHELQRQVSLLQRKLRQKDDEFRFETRQMKERIKQLNEALLNKDKKFTPQNLSQDETASFLIKTIKKVIKSGDMMRMLAKNDEFRKIVGGLQRQLRQFRK